MYSRFFSLFCFSLSLSLALFSSPQLFLLFLLSSSSLPFSPDVWPALVPGCTIGNYSPTATYSARYKDIYSDDIALSFFESFIRLWSLTLGSVSQCRNDAGNSCDLYHFNVSFDVWPRRGWGQLLDVKSGFLTASLFLFSALWIFVFVSHCLPVFSLFQAPVLGSCSVSRKKRSTAFHPISPSWILLVFPTLQLYFSLGKCGGNKNKGKKQLSVMNRVWIEKHVIMGQLAGRNEKKQNY